MCLAADVVTVAWDVPAVGRTPDDVPHRPMRHISMGDLQADAIRSRWRVDDRQRRGERGVAPGTLHQEPWYPDGLPIEPQLRTGRFNDGVNDDGTEKAKFACNARQHGNEVGRRFRLGKLG